MSLTGNSHPILTRGSRVPRAPPRPTLRGGFPAFQNVPVTLLGYFEKFLSGPICRFTATIHYDAIMSVSDERHIGPILDKMRSNNVLG